MTQQKIRMGERPKDQLDLASLLNRRKSTIKNWAEVHLTEISFNALVDYCKRNKIIPVTEATWNLEFKTEPKNALVFLPVVETEGNDSSVLSVSKKKPKKIIGELSADDIVHAAVIIPDVT